MVKGVRELQTKLTKTIPALVREATSKAMEQGATEIVAMMKRLVPIESGELRDSIGWTWGQAPRYSQKIATVKGQEGDLAITIYAGNEKVRYAHLIEFGTRAHVNKGKFDGTQHPGSAAQPFFYVSFRTLRKKTRSRITRAMRKAIRTEAATTGDE